MRVTVLRGGRPLRCIPAVAVLALGLSAEARADNATTSATTNKCIAANEGAIRFRTEHKFRQAREQAIVCAADTCPGAIREVCRKRVTDLDAAIPTIVFEVKDARGRDLDQVRVTMDGEPLVDRLDGTAIAVDPGEHAFVFEAADAPRLERHLLLYEGAKGRREAMAIEQPAAPLAPVATTAPATMEREPSPHGLGTRKIVGLTMAGAGVVGVALGAVFGIETMSAWSSVKTACRPGGPGACPDANRPSVTSDHDNARFDGTVSTIAFVAGGALVAGGLTVFFTRSHDESTAKPATAVAPLVGSRFAGMGLHGTF